MSTKVSDVFFVRRRNDGFGMVPQIIKVEDGRYALTRPTVTTMAASLSPLLTSMKLFGLYFKRGTDAGDQTADEKSRCRWNGCMIHSLVVLILVWINVIRMFSVLSNV